jgi:hypothetical protein
MNEAITLLQINLETMLNNAPINESRGNIEQAELERANAQSYLKAIELLTQASA